MRPCGRLVGGGRLLEFGGGIEWRLLQRAGDPGQHRSEPVGRVCLSEPRVRRRGEWERDGRLCRRRRRRQLVHSRLHGDRRVEHGDRCVEGWIARAVLPQRGIGVIRESRAACSSLGAGVRGVTGARVRSGARVDAATGPAATAPAAFAAPSAARTRRSSGESADRHRHDCDATRSEGDRESDDHRRTPHEIDVSTASPRASSPRAETPLVLRAACRCKSDHRSPQEPMQPPTKSCVVVTTLP